MRTRSIPSSVAQSPNDSHPRLSPTTLTHERTHAQPAAVAQGGTQGGANQEVPTSDTHTLHPIGHVAVGEHGFELVLDERVRPALQGIEGFSHLTVLWWADHLDTPEARSLTVLEHPYRRGPESLGVFATRSPARPNPIAVTIASVLAVHENRVAVAYIDADDGTPILDIKPYHPSVDRVREVAVPHWCSDWPQWYEDSAEFDWSGVFDTAR